MNMGSLFRENVVAKAGMFMHWTLVSLVFHNILAGKFLSDLDSRPQALLATSG